MRFSRAQIIGPILLLAMGSYGFAREGFTVEQILKSYYTGIELTKLYN